ncbi:MAG: DUF2231 domain-containing protein [Actinomycetota bacterium]
MARLFSIKPALSFKGRKFKGLRGWAGKPSHPPLTDIPIGAYIIAAVFDVISFVKGEGDLAQTLFRAGTYVLIVGVVVSIPTALTGFWDWLKSTPKHTQAWRTANWHMTVMLTTTALVLTDILVRLGNHDERSATTFGIMALTVVIAGLVSLGAAYGGTLVYEYEFNVEQDKGWAWEESETDVYPDGSKK